MAQGDEPVETAIPEGYPAHLEGVADLGEAGQITIRPIVPADVAEIEKAYEEADSETLLHRFFTAAPNLGDKQIHYLAEVDYDRRLALVAFAEDGQGVGIARYEGLTDPEHAEVAVVVHAEWRRRGIATELLGRLEEPARQRGISEFVAVYLPMNRAVAAVFDGLGYDKPKIVDGVARVEKRIG